MKKLFLLLATVLSLTVSAQENARFRTIDSLLSYLNHNNRFMGQVSILEGDDVVAMAREGA